MVIRSMFCKQLRKKPQRNNVHALQPSRVDRLGQVLSRRRWTTLDRVKGFQFLNPSIPDLLAVFKPELLSLL